jgi:hypothetical protein
MTRAWINPQDHRGGRHPLYLSQHLIGDVEIGRHVLHVLMVL